MTIFKIVETVEAKIQNTFEAEIVSVRPNSMMFQILDSDAKVLMFAKDVATVRLRDLTEVFREGDCFPITISEITKEPTETGTWIKLLATMKPTFGTRDEIIAKLGGNPRWMPVIRDYLGDKLCFLVSPNVISLEENVRDTEGDAIYAMVNRVSDRGKVRLRRAIPEGECPYSGEDTLRRFFFDCAKRIDDMDAYTDVEEFNRNLSISDAKHDTTFTEETDSSLYDPTRAIVYPQPQGRYNNLFLTKTVGIIRSCPESQRALEVETRLFRGFYTEHMIKELEEPGENGSVIDRKLWGDMVANNILAKTKIVCPDLEPLELYCNSINFRFIVENSVPKLAEQVTPDADWILRSLSVNRVLLKMYKKDKSIVNELRRNWLVSLDLNCKKSERFRALALLDKSKIIIDSCRSIEHAENIASKILRINHVLTQLHDKQTLYVLCRTTEIEDAIRKRISGAKLPRLTVYTATDKYYEEKGEFSPVGSIGLFARLFGKR